MAKRKYFQVKASDPDPLSELSALRKKQRIQEDHSLTKHTQHDYHQRLLCPSPDLLIKLLYEVDDQIPDTVLRRIAEYNPSAVAEIWPKAFSLYCRFLREIIISPTMPTQALRTEAQVEKLVITKNAEICELAALADIMTSSRTTGLSNTLELQCYASHWRQIQHLSKLFANLRSLIINCNKQISLHHILLRCPQIRRLRIRNFKCESTGTPQTCLSDRLEILDLSLTESSDEEVVICKTPKLRILHITGTASISINLGAPSIIITSKNLPNTRAECVWLREIEMMKEGDILSMVSGTEALRVVAFQGLSNAEMTLHLIKLVYTRTEAEALIIPLEWPVELVSDEAVIAREALSKEEILYDPLSFKTDQMSISEACENPLPRLRPLKPLRKLEVLRISEPNRLIEKILTSPPSTPPPFECGGGRAGRISCADEPPRRIIMKRWADEEALRLFRRYSLKSPSIL